MFLTLKTFLLLLAMFLITFLLSFVLVDGQSNGRIYPLNTAVIAGKQFYLVCEKHLDRITPTISWRFLRESTYADRAIYNGTHLSDEFRDFQVHSTADGLSNLTKRFSSIDDAGTYRCIQRYGSDYVVSSAQVIVFASDPVCSPKETHILEGQHLQINCSVHYAGSISPIMKWSIGNGMDSNFDANVTNVSSNSFTISSLKQYATRRDNNVTFQCTTYFNQPIISNEDQTAVRKAINAPTYEHQCTHRLNVLFEPEAVDITPKKDVYSLGDVLLCNAKGNPTPTYEWRELGSNRVVSRESSLTVDSTAMESHAYKCTATNNATENGTSISTRVTIHTIIRSPIDSTDVRSVSIVVGAVFALLCVVAVFTVCIKRLKARLCRDEATQHNVTTDLKNSGQHLSYYESIDNIDTQVDIESIGLQVDRLSLSEHQEKPKDFDNTAKRPAENQTPPTDQNMIPVQELGTGYDTLGDRSSPPPPTVYERLNVEEPATQDASSHTSEYTSDKTSSTARGGVGIYQNHDHVPYVNVNQVTLVGKVREY